MRAINMAISEKVSFILRIWYFCRGSPARLFVRNMLFNQQGRIKNRLGIEDFKSIYSKNSFFNLIINSL